MLHRPFQPSIRKAPTPFDLQGGSWDFKPTRKAPMCLHHSSSLLSSSPDFFAAFFFFFLFLPEFLESGCSRIFKISSSVIFLSDLYCAGSTVGGAAKRVNPFLVIAV